MTVEDDAGGVGDQGLRTRCITDRQVKSIQLIKTPLQRGRESPYRLVRAKRVRGMLIKGRREDIYPFKALTKSDLAI